MTAQALAWAWLNAFQARPFSLLETPGKPGTKRFSLLAGEPLFVLEGRGAKAAVVCGGRRWPSRKTPEAAFAALGRALAGRKEGPAFWPLMTALSYEAGARFEAQKLPKAEPVGLPDWVVYLPGLWAWWDLPARKWKCQQMALSAPLARRVAAALGVPGAALRPAQASRAWELELLKALVHGLSNAKAGADAGSPAVAGLVAAAAASSIKSTPRPGTLKDNLGRAAYERRVRAVQAHIAAGDIYQANLAHRYQVPFHGEPFGLYRRLTAINPSPMAAYVDLGGVQVISASPERLFRQQGDQVETWPIAGTAPNRGRPGERAALRRSLKDAAEHVMLVDLERNDLGRVCVGGSVKVPKFKAVETYSHVHHLVSQVTGKLLRGMELPEILAAGFPGGSITGAPKIRCMQIIAAQEGQRRGWYTGSLGWWEPRQRRADLNILIRTLYVKGGQAYGSVGSGIVADSEPRKEWDETLAKAAALLKALGVKGAGK